MNIPLEHPASIQELLPAGTRWGTTPTSSGARVHAQLPCVLTPAEAAALEASVRARFGEALGPVTVVGPVLWIYFIRVTPYRDLLAGLTTED
jgi:hypothetical protein